MPFKKRSDGKYVTPSGRVYTKAQKDAYQRRKRRKRK